MDFLTDISAARGATIAFVAEHAAELPEGIKGRLIEVASSVSPVDQICNVVELLYARHSEIGEAGRVLLGRMAAFADDNGWHELRNGRGRAITLAMMRELGEPEPLGMSFPDPADDPAPSPRFAEEE
jgi:hypothetical protein